MPAQHDAATCFCQPGLFIRAFWHPTRETSSRRSRFRFALLLLSSSLAPPTSPPLSSVFLDRLPSLDPRFNRHDLINISNSNSIEDSLERFVEFLWIFEGTIGSIIKRFCVDETRLDEDGLINGDMTSHGRKMERIDGADQMADSVSRFPGFCLLDYASFAISVFGARSVYSYARLFGSRRPCETK